MDDWEKAAIGAAFSMAGIVVGFSLNGITGLVREQRDCRGHWIGIRADIVAAGATAAGYLKGGVQAPAYRAPLAMYASSLAALLRAELVSEDDIGKLTRFFNNAESFNKSLDWAQDALGVEKKFEREVGRAELKARKIATGETQYREALECVDGHIRRRTGHWLLFWK
jgi:hypothetical protein